MSSKISFASILMLVCILLFIHQHVYIAALSYSARDLLDRLKASR